MMDGDEGQVQEAGGGEALAEPTTMADVERDNTKNEAEFSAGFDDSDTDGGGEDDGDGDGVKRDDNGRFAKKDADDDDDDGEPEPKPTAKPPAKSKPAVDADAADADKPDKPDKPDDPAEDAPVEKPKAVAPAASKTSFEIATEALASLDEGDFEVNGKKVNLKEYIEDYPEESAVAAAIAAKIAEKMIGGFQPDTQMAERMLAMEEEFLAYRFWDSVAGEFPDAKRLAASQPFGDWVAKQSSGIKTLAASVDPGDALTVLRMFTKETAPAAAPAPKSKVKERAANLYSDTAKNGGGSTTNVAKDDFDAGFNM